jgi:pyruvate,orthophosphate dikinase
LLLLLIIPIQNDVNLNEQELKKLCNKYKDVFQKHGQDFPSDPQEQLKDCIKAVFGSRFFSWAVKYREINKIKNLIGTGANVQMMVFGNMGNDSGTGIAFSRNPSTGANELYGKYLINAQGEDVVTSIHTPQPISQMHDVLPNAYKQFVTNINKLEKHFKEMQDMEFTIERGKLWMLQC